MVHDEITRYSRQIIMPDFNIEGQCSLKSSRALIVGVGGLGCPAALYLAAAGIGNLTLLDYDTVELTNLHRQVLHYECDIGVPKVESAYKKLKSINHNINIEPINLHVNSMTIEELLKKNKFDVVLDCTDNVTTRYLLNDICVLYKIPLVSGSALQFEGQLTVYNYKNGPCYRCLFPVPPPPDSVTSCGDGGVLGAVPGTIGVLQALEAIKVIQNSSGVLSARLLLFDGSTTTFRNVKLRGRSKVCAVCGDDPTVTSLIDYEQFCGSSAHDKVNNIHILQQNQNIDFRSLSLLKDQLILDVRPEIEYNMCKLPNTHNIPYSDLLKGKNLEQVEALLKNARNNVYVLCRRGNDSQRAIVLLKEKFGDFPLNFINVSGGLHSYSKHIDSGFPVY
ncbi:adenylyltransferase and sulfurtransferase MOCS3-like isoform X2 [Aethina tumida]|uniref:adenylyltransferase and sulfurtransferase MOCS3-like isoform X2 n=1 Tax=Aethina tumida TaxID=116153 RepID=UPI0021489FC1|nr:adenylyltransferase and sulfurtransferase MOCS3-like isoform X2 [Aethina tumida]